MTPTNATSLMLSLRGSAALSPFRIDKIGHCRRPIIQGVGMSVHAGGQSFHYECARSPYATNEQALKEKNNE